MPRGDRGQGSPHLGGYGVLLAIILCAIIAGGLSYSSGLESERRNNTPARYSSAAKSDAKGTCVGMEAGAAFECIYEKVEASTDQAHSEQDLSAQQRAATSALVTTILSGVALILSGVGVWFIKGTLDATLKAVEDTGRATDAMREANEIAQQANRAWVTIEIEPTFVSISGKKCNVRCDLKFANMGNGVAVRFSYIATLKAKSGDEGEFVPDEFINIHVKNETPEVPNSKVTIVPRDCYVINAVCTDEYIGKSISGLKFLLTVSAFYRISDADPVWRKSVRAFEITRKGLKDTRLKRTTFPPFTEHETLRTESLASQVKTGLLAT